MLPQLVTLALPKLAWEYVSDTYRAFRGEPKGEDQTFKIMEQIQQQYFVSGDLSKRKFSQNDVMEGEAATAIDKLESEIRRFRREGATDAELQKRIESAKNDLIPALKRSYRLDKSVGMKILNCIEAGAWAGGIEMCTGIATKVFHSVTAVPAKVLSSVISKLPFVSSLTNVTGSFMPSLNITGSFQLPSFFPEGIVPSSRDWLIMASCFLIAFAVLVATEKPKNLSAKLI